MLWIYICIAIVFFYVGFITGILFEQKCKLEDDKLILELKKSSY